VNSSHPSQVEIPAYAVPKKDPHLLDHFTLLAKYRKTVLGTIFGTALFFAGLSLVIKHEYQAETSLLPPEKQSMGGLMSILTGSGGGGALDFMKGGENPAIDLFKNILDSRSLAEIVASDPRVHRYYSQWDTSRTGILELVDESMESEPMRNGLMSVTVTVPTFWMPEQAQQDTAKELSAYMANLFVSELDRYNRERLMTTAKSTRIFVEGAYKERMRQLDSTYALLQEFQQENKTISLPDQLEATVTAAATLAGQVQQLEIQLGVEEKELNANSVRIQMLRDQLSEAKQALAKYDAGGVGEYVIALNEVPALARKLAHYTREVKLLETISAFLRQQVEQERIAEQKDLPSLHVLDKATVPEKRSFPRRAQMLVLGLVVGIVLSNILVIILRYRDDLRARPHEHTKFLNFTRTLRAGKRGRIMVTPPVPTPASTSSINEVQFKDSRAEV
jgi:tyrosine-protein kinase Etk/Wzc